MSRAKMTLKRDRFGGLEQPLCDFTDCLYPFRHYRQGQSLDNRKIELAK
jgi:hypothetical protein